MKKILVLAVALVATASASAQYIELAPNYNPEMARQTLTHNKEINLEFTTQKLLLRTDTHPAQPMQ